MTRRAPTYLRQPGDGEGLMPRQASIILHMGVVKAPLCNSGLSVSHLTEVFETLRKAVPVTFLFLSYMGPLSLVSRGEIGEGDTGKDIAAPTENLHAWFSDPLMILVCLVHDSRNC